MRPPLGVTARPYSNLQSPWKEHKAESLPRCHSKPFWRRHRSGKILEKPNTQVEPSPTTGTAEQSGFDIVIYSLRPRAPTVRRFGCTQEDPRTALSRASKSFREPAPP